MTLDAETSATITGYRPQNPQPEWDLVAGHVRMLVAASADRSPCRVERLLTATTRLAVWCHRSGLPDDPEVWLRHETIDAFILTECTGLAPNSAQTYRSWLRHMRATLAWLERGEQAPPPMKAPKTVSPPYSPTQLSRLRSWAERLPGQARGDALALMALAFGCGLTAGEVAAVRTDHLRRLDSGAVVVTAPGAQRLIVCRAAWEDVLAGAADQDSDTFVFRSRRAARHARNLFSTWTARHPPTGGLPALSVRRLRASWIVELLTARIDLGVIAAAAGMSASALARYHHFVPALDEPTAVALLRGRNG
ncbi:hypothetical protein FE391_40295 [Nonomuraea sp. KC401]|uniref:hypothetical protein n=1 Tax=unclassified Nonomuraea TaxID=2593643 RepID=UPI0010FE8D73|nr:MULTISPECIES: hypothetical protein [unclassified Nonomuraea]NBE99774.1 hypothetical protein [Nonomuraea sp. K271]TLF55649.1 hypothetical protein FE391_40295 [Nonomuraea sp. KC401]